MKKEWPISTAEKMEKSRRTGWPTVHEQCISVDFTGDVLPGHDAESDTEATNLPR